jgi:hypothetical protein
MKGIHVAVIAIWVLQVCVTIPIGWVLMEHLIRLEVRTARLCPPIVGRRLDYAVDAAGCPL